MTKFWTALFFIHFAFLFTLSHADVIAGGVRLHASFKVMAVDKTKATCNEYTKAGVLVGSRSETAPGCVVKLKTMALISSTRPQLQNVIAYLKASKCAIKPNETIELNLWLRGCHNPINEVDRKEPYCKTADFDELQKITGESWACMIGNLWSEVVDKESR